MCRIQHFLIDSYCNFWLFILCVNESRGVLVMNGYLLLATYLTVLFPLVWVACKADCLFNRH